MSSKTWKLAASINSWEYKKVLQGPHLSQEGGYLFAYLAYLVTFGYLLL